MPGGEGEVLELVRFVDKQVVDIHFLEIDTAVLPVLNGVKHRFQFVFQVFLANLQSL